MVLTGFFSNFLQTDVMKTGYIKIIGCLLVCSTALSCSCRDDDEGPREQTKHYRLTVKAIGPDSENVRDNVYFYLFDDGDKLAKVVKGNLDQEADIELARKSKYSAVALGYSPETPVPNIPLGTSIEDAQIILSTKDFVGNKVATSPGDIFHGIIELKENANPECPDIPGAADTAQIVWIKRKVAALTIIARNLQSELNTTDEDFSYVVRQTSGTLDFRGNLKGDKVAYHPTSHFSTTNHDLVAPMFYTYPSASDEGFAVDIYKGNTLLKSYFGDNEESPMLLKEGKHTVVFIDFRKDATDNGDGFLDVTCKVLDWTDTNINEGFH